MLVRLSVPPGRAHVLGQGRPGSGGPPAYKMLSRRPLSSPPSSRALCDAALPGAVPAYDRWETRPSPSATSRPPVLRHVKSRKPDTYVIPPKEQRVAVVGAGAVGPRLRAEPRAEAVPGHGLREGGRLGRHPALASALRRVRRRHRPAVLRGGGGVPLRHGDHDPGRARRLRRRLSSRREPGASRSGFWRAGTPVCSRPRARGLPGRQLVRGDASWRPSLKGSRPPRSSRCTCRRAGSPARRDRLRQGETAGAIWTTRRRAGAAWSQASRTRRLHGGRGAGRGRSAASSAIATTVWPRARC